MAYPIGRAGAPWNEEERNAWLDQSRIQRSYQVDVIDRLYQLSPRYDLHRYGALSSDPLCYPLYALTSPEYQPEMPSVLVTGGVHGYETSGILGAIEFLETNCEKYLGAFNFVVVPCVSPWGYETINRWNSQAIDPNRSFKGQGLCEESSALIVFLDNLQRDFIMHVDLHETTDTDESEFRPALAARDGKEFEPCQIPDGFYLVGDSASPRPGFQRSIIERVAAITHIAPNDGDGKLLGVPAEQEGVINYDVGPLGLCAGFTSAPYKTTTEVYPDSHTAHPEECIRAQVAALEGALDYIRVTLSR
jgi:hypothetical protein